MGKRKELQRIIPGPQAVDDAIAWARDRILAGLPGGPVLLTLGRPRRSPKKNAHLWAVLNDLAAQVKWHGQSLSPEQWKDIFTAAMRDQEHAPGLDGGVVFFGQSTSRMTDREVGDLIEMIYAFGSERGVVWTEKKLAPAGGR